MNGSVEHALIEASLLNARLIAAAAGLPLPQVRGALEVGDDYAKADADVVDVASLRREFLYHHERVLGSSLATVSRYRSATQHLENFVAQNVSEAARGSIDVAAFVAYLRQIEVSPNGHPCTSKRKLRDKGIRYVLECGRALFRFGDKHGLISRSAENPFAEFGIHRLKFRDAKVVSDEEDRRS